MIPVYDPKSFATIDLRKYHIRDIADVIKFHEFVVSRMEEAQFVLKKFNTQYATYQSVASQLQKRVEQQAVTYGNPSAKPQEATQEVEIQKVDNTVEEAHNALLDDIKKAVAEESIAPTEEHDANYRAVAELENYKVTLGKKGPMFYRKFENGFKLVSKADVPEDIKESLIAAAEDNA